MIFLFLGWLAILWTYTDAFPRPFDDWKNTLFYVGAGIAIIAYSLVRRSRAAAPPLPRMPIFVIITYFAIAIVSLIMAPTARYEGLLALARLILWLGAAWFFAQLSTKHWLWFMRLTVVSAALITILTWLQSRGVLIWPYDTPFFPPIGHITYYGDFMALSLIMALGLVFQKKQYLWLIPTCLIDVGLTLSATRASLVGIIAAFIISVPLIWLSKRSFKSVAIIALLGFLNFAVIFTFPTKSLRGASASERLQQATMLSQAPLDTTSIDVASSGRWHTYITSAHIAMKHPISGWGIGSFRFVYPEFAHRNAPDALVSSSTWYMHPHNEILHQAVEVGWLGAVIWVIGVGYLLYRGILKLRRDENNETTTLLITAICGLVAAFVSWQFSTNFLFPVSRLMTALFAGIILHVMLRARPEGSQVRSFTTFRITMLGVIALSTILIIANQASIYCVQKEQMARDVRAKQDWATWAVRLAPGAFDPLYIRATVALQTLSASQAAPDVETLYASYPYVPAVLHMMGYLRAQQGHIPEARKLLQHAFTNDPNNTTAKQLLDQLPPAH